jgi:hypothetical protein
MLSFVLSRRWWFFPSRTIDNSTFFSSHFFPLFFFFSIYNRFKLGEENAHVEFLCSCFRLFCFLFVGNNEQRMNIYSMIFLFFLEISTVFPGMEISGRNFESYFYLIVVTMGIFIFLMGTRRLHFWKNNVFLLLWITWKIMFFSLDILN